MPTSWSSKQLALAFSSTRDALLTDGSIFSDRRVVRDDSVFRAAERVYIRRARGDHAGDHRGHFLRLLPTWKLPRVRPAVHRLQPEVRADDPWRDERDLDAGMRLLQLLAEHGRERIQVVL